MSRENLIAIVLCSCVVGFGCNAKPPAAEGTPTPSKSPPASHGDAGAAGPAAHGSNADPHADPHAGLAQDPHAGLPPATPPGPPRDVTPNGETREELVDGLKLMVPSEWERGAGSSMMRKAEFTLPGPGGDATLVVYRFQGGAGSTQQNIDRWKQQIVPAEGAEAETAQVDSNGLKVGSIDVRGAYAGQSMPGAPPQPPIADARLLAAAIEGVGDPWYLKLVGPAATIDVWGAAWTQLLTELAPAA
ncbi:hypothetical protein [Enhygromyxa salina]|uniref:Uncharacterized protein n=1 Tax=Enhygromyxa salina TaxID=215803 RepID=A0A2S9XLZ4_9BACT|nr:hypothetical protein [Enhygromyxa salina]PRP93872.1 hypothetical protein ENSA7_79130 [Enhygromyxa salina]